MTSLPLFLCLQGPLGSYGVASLNAAHSGFLYLLRKPPVLFHFFFNWKMKWCTTLCWFQAYSTVSWHLQTLWNEHCDKANIHLSPYKVITILLIMFLMLYVTSLWLYFITGGLYFLILYFLIPVTYFTCQYPSSLATTHFFPLTI